ncbi:MAG: cell division protein FtsL [Pseudomonadota bacterium]
MKTPLYVICCGLIVAMAYWAYKENYRTQASLRRVAALQADIAAERVAISVLRAEWAYLNRPERLRELVALTFPDLGLMPLMPEHFADAELVAYPAPPAPEAEIKDPVSTAAPLNGPAPDKEFP